MKKKLITLLISSFLVFNNISSSFANPLVIAPVTISYEALMALMGIGLSFGLSLPKDDTEYWDYTRSLKRHLQVVDDDYLDKLDKSVKEWKINNNNKPDNEKEPLKVPFIPGLDNLFNNVLNDRKQTMEYINNSLTNDNVYTSYDNPNNVSFVDLPFTLSYINAKGFSANLEVSLTENNLLQIKNTTSDGYENIRTSSSASGTWELMKTGYVFYKDSSDRIYPMIVGFYNNEIKRWVSGISQGSNYYYSTPANTNPTYNNKPIEDEFVNPSVENDLLNIGTLPNINIPSSETLPGFENGAQSPFDVQDPIDIPSTETPPETDTETPPETDTETPPETDTSFPSFPSFGDSLDFSPMYLTNVTEKFPFSLPWDLGRLIEKFDVDPVAPIFEVPIFSETITLDLTEFSELASIVRFFVLIGFVLSLIFISTKLKG